MREENCELKTKIMVEEALKRERDDSDRRYALKWVERIILGIIAAILLFFVNQALHGAFSSATSSAQAIIQTQ
jgi:hypothetical protein